MSRVSLRAAVVALAAATGCFDAGTSTPTRDAGVVGRSCRLPSDCGEGSDCVRGVCTAECVDERDCVGSAGGPVCDRGTGRCVAAARDAATDDAPAAPGDTPVAGSDASTTSGDVPASPVDAAPGDAGDPQCTGCDENTSRASGCDECGGGGNWGAPLFAYRGVCAYSNGATTDVESCQSPPATQTSDGQTPLGCSGGTVHTFLGDARRASYAFQCVEYARRLTVGRVPAWNAIGGNACEWWNRARDVAGVARYENGGSTAPMPDDLLVFYSPGDRCGERTVGHIGVVSRVDAATGRVTMIDQNRGSAPAELAYAVSEGRHRVATFGSYVLKGWIRVGAADLTCGVRTYQYGGEARTSPGSGQLVGCPAGYVCDVDASSCQRIATCERGEACPEGTRCDGRACVCDPSRPITATSFSFDGSAHCFSAGPYVAGAEGCSMSVGIARDPGGVRALLLRDLDDQDPSLISPRVDWDLAPDQFIDVEMSCRGLRGPATTEARIYLSPAGTRPSFSEGPLSVGRVSVTCDGSLRRLRFPISTLPAGMRRVGWLRFDPLDGERRFAGAEVWVRRISVERGGSTDCGALSNCSGRCVDTSSDGSHCGACGNVCGAGLRCSSGRCSRECAAGETLCNGTSCANLSVDATNCGACNRRCPAGQSCVAGACQCPTPLRECGGACVDVQSNAAHCGGCGNLCPSGQSCVAGACRCVGSLVACNGACVDTQSSNAHCGACGNACPAGLTCGGGSCRCAGSLQSCSGACVDTQTSNAHCGGCGNACPSGQLCSGGSCRCTGSLVACDGGCVDTQTSNAHCGGCFRACSAQQTCRSGACVSTSTCGAAGQGCCGGTSCSAGLYCIRGICQQDATPGLPVIRFGNVCNSQHWHATTSCYPSASSPTLGCTCSQRVTNPGCGTATCWRRESSLNTASANPGYGSFFEVFHCFVSGGNRYARSPCAAGTVGDPPTLGWMASSPVGPYAIPVYLCRWTASGVVEEFFTTSSTECTAVGTVVGGAPFGYAS